MNQDQNQINNNTESMNNMMNMNNNVNQNNMNNGMNPNNMNSLNNNMMNMNNNGNVMMPNQNNSQPQKTNKTVILIVIIAVVAIVAILFLVLGKGDKNNTNNTNPSSTIQDIDTGNNSESSGNESDAATNFSYKDQGLKGQNVVYFLLDNKNNKSVNASVSVKYYDANKQLLSERSEVVSFIPPNSQYNLRVFGPFEGVFDSYEVVINSVSFNDFGSTNLKDVFLMDKVKISNEKQDDEYITIDAKNESDKEITGINYTLLLYDANNNIVGITSEGQGRLAPGETRDLRFTIPVTPDYKGRIQFSKYKIFVDTAYHLN